MKNIFKLTRASCTSDSIKPGSSLNDTKVEESFVVASNFDSVIDWIKKTHSGEFILGPEINIQNEEAYQKDWLWFGTASTWHGKPGSGVYSSCWDMTVSVNGGGKLITLERKLYGKGWKGFAYKYHIVYRNIPVVEIF
jgi:hypothetical protein